MDIFTTQLTRVVQTPIKPRNLKVKALLKEAANSKLSHDPDHLENHKYYFMREENQSHDEYQPQQSEQVHKEDHNAERLVDEVEANLKDEQKKIPIDVDEVTYEKHGSEVSIEIKSDDDEDNTKHLDLYA